MGSRSGTDRLRCRAICAIIVCTICAAAVVPYGWRMFEGTEAKVFEALFWFFCVACALQPLFHSGYTQFGWRDDAEWVAKVVAAGSMALFFTLRRIRPANEGWIKLWYVITAAVVVLLGLNLVAFFG